VRHDDVGVGQDVGLRHPRLDVDMGGGVPSASVSMARPIVTMTRASSSATALRIARHAAIAFESFAREGP
jgi:hypothetical protein